MMTPDELAYATRITLGSPNCNAAEVLRLHLSELGMSESCIQQDGSLELKNGLEFFVPSSMHDIMGRRDPYRIEEISSRFPDKEFSLTVHFGNKPAVHYHVQNGRETDVSQSLQREALADSAKRVVNGTDEETTVQDSRRAVRDPIGGRTATVGREASIHEEATAPLLSSVTDLQKNPTGWRMKVYRDTVTLVSEDGRRAVDFPIANQRSGSEALRAQITAQAWAIDHLYSMDIAWREQLANATQVTLSSPDCHVAEVLRPHLSVLGMTEEHIRRDGTLRFKNESSASSPCNPCAIKAISRQFPGKTFALVVHFENKPPTWHRIQSGEVTDWSKMLDIGFAPKVCQRPFVAHPAAAATLVWKSRGMHF